MKIIIKAKDIKVSKGHSSHRTGTGAHGDKRTKRERTRAQRNRKAIREG